MGNKLSLLTPRELEVLRHLLAGESNKQTGRALGISGRTVEVHRGHIFEKLEVKNLVQLALLVYASEETGPELSAVRDALAVEQPTAEAKVNAALREIEQLQRRLDELRASVLDR